MKVCGRMFEGKFFDAVIKFLLVLICLVTLGIGVSLVMIILRFIGLL